MPLLSWQKWWTRTPAHRNPAAKKSRFRKFFLESLEDRVLLSNTYTVNLAGDAGISSGQFSGDIRYCINQADLPANIGSTIKFGSISGGVIKLSTNELEISQDMNIVGPGASKLTIDGGTVFVNNAGQVSNGVRVFNITSQNATVTISGLTITNGDANPANNLQFAGNQGGDIFNSGKLTLQNDVVSNGVSFGIIGAPPGRGGGIFNARNATLTVDNTVVTGNQAIGQPGQGGGIFSDTGAALNIINGSSITNNTARGDFGLNGVHGFTPSKGPGGPGGSGTSVAGGGGWGGGIFTTGGSITITGNSKTPIVLSGNLAIGGDGGNGGTGGNAGGAPSGALQGFHGGTGGPAGAASDGLGGGLYVATGAASLNFVQLTNNTAQGGLGGHGGDGGNGGNGGASGPGGIGGAAGASGAGGNARGGGLYTVTATGFSIANTQFSGNQAIGGNAGIAGNGGPGGAGNGPAHGGTGGLAGGSTVGGDVQGGAIFNGGGALTIDSSQFTNSSATSGTGGTGGNGGTGGASGTKTPRVPTEVGGTGANGAAGSRSGQAWGGAIYNGGGGDLTLGATAPVTFTNNVVTTATGGSGGIGGGAGNGLFIGGQGGNGGDAGGSTFAYGGALALEFGNLTIFNGTFTGSKVVGGAGGAGGLAGVGGNGDNGTPPTPGDGGNGGAGGLGGGGSFAYGGAISLSKGAGNLALIGTSITGSTDTSGDGGIGGIGGGGGTGGNKFGFGGNGGNGGNGGVAGAAGGGAISYFVQSGGTGVSDTVTLTSNTLSNNKAIGGTGGAGNVGGVKGIPGSNLRGDPFVPPYGVAGFSGSGGAAADTAGGALYLADGREATNVTFTTNAISGNSVQGGTGGLGAAGAGSLPRLPGSGFGVTTGTGGNGGVGGTAEGGGVAFLNTSGAIQTLSFNSDLLSSNKVTGGTGGGGGNAGSSGSLSIAGGTGGVGGQASGAGVYSLASSLSVNYTTFTGTTLTGNVVTGGTGGQGGAGFEAPGGIGGLGAGGAIFSTSANTNNFSTLTLNGNTLIVNQAVGGVGGAAGSGTTPNGGQGGNGGIGGNGEGGAIFGGNNTQWTILNNTIGSFTTGGNAGNSVLGGLGGRGGNAGTPAAKPSNNGGNGGNGGNGIGGAVFLNSGSAEFLNNTIIENQATTGGLGGAPGGGAGLSGVAGTPGTAGTGSVGGYFAAGATGTTGNPTVNKIGNNIIDLNAAGSSPDVKGVFASQGHNILGSTAGASGFVASDQTGITQAQLNLGPLQSNGGPVVTNAVLPGSILLDAGDSSLLPASNPDAPQGTQVAWLQNGSTISQAVTFAAGSYTLSLFAAQRANLPSNTTIQVQIDGSTVASITSSSTTYSAFTTPSFTVTAGKHTIAFLGVGTGVSTALLDQITILSGGVPAATQPSDPGFETPNVGSGFVVAPSSSPWKFTGGSGVAGNGSALTGGDTTDQRGPGFVRTFGSSVDAGAFEFQQPVITGYNPASGSINRGHPDFSLTIFGNGFMPGATVNFGGTILTPTSILSGQITVTIPAALVAKGGPISVTVTEPDGSGVAGNTITGPASTFVVSTPSTVTVNNPGNQTNNESDSVDLTVTSTDVFATNWTAVGLPAGLSITPDTGEILGTIGAYAAGTYSVTVSATDNGVTGSTNFTWTVNATSPPQIFNPGNPTSAAGTAVLVGVGGTHVDPGTFSATGLPPGLSINPNTGVISGTLLPSDSGQYTVTVSATRNGIPGSTSFTWTVTSTGGAAGFFTIGFGTMFPLPVPGQSAGFFGLALEEFALTLSPTLSILFASIGQPNAQFKNQIPELVNAINHDPLHGTPTGTIAEFLGFQAAMKILGGG